VLFFRPISVALESVGKNKKSRCPEADKNAEALGFRIFIGAFLEAPNRDGCRYAGESGQEAGVAHRAQRLGVSFLQRFRRQGAKCIECHVAPSSPFEDKQGVQKISRAKAMRTPLLM
jgi:hypothetical protein